MDGLIILYLVLFPFGKLTWFLPDIIVFVLSFWGIFEYKFKINNLIFICIYSLLFSFSLFKLPMVFNGVLYLARFISYLVFSKIIQTRFTKTKKKKEFLFNSLIAVGVFIAVFGWIQYFIFPDLRGLKILGWDDHYFRLTSVFLDPAFTGILLVLTEVLVIIKTIKNKSNINFFINIVLLITILFTYSRASYLSFLFAIAFLFFKFKEKFMIFLAIVFVSLIFLLPKQSGGEGVNLARTYSIVDRFVNYKDSLTIIKKSPVFGVGFNNICIAKEKFLGETNVQSHSCSGLDNGILFIGATGGILGLFIFFQFILSIIKNTESGLPGYGVMASLIAVFVHGMFTNTFFYNFVLGWLAILIGITRIKDYK